MVLALCANESVPGLSQPEVVVEICRKSQFHNNRRAYWGLYMRTRTGKVHPVHPRVELSSYKSAASGTGDRSTGSEPTCGNHRPFNKDGRWTHNLWSMRAAPCRYGANEPSTDVSSTQRAGCSVTKREKDCRTDSLGTKWPTESDKTHTLERTGDSGSAKGKRGDGAGHPGTGLDLLTNAWRLSFRSGVTLHTVAN